MLVVTRDQQEGMPVAIGQFPETCDFSAVVDSARHLQLQVGSVRDKTVQVDDLAVLPEKRMRDGTVTRERLAHNLVRQVDAETRTAIVAVYSAKISYHALFPKERVHGVVWICCVTRNRALIIDRVCVPKTASESSQVDPLSSAPKKRMRRYFIRKAGIADKLTALVRPKRVDHGPSEPIGNVRHLAFLIEKRVERRDTGERIGNVAGVGGTKYLTTVVNNARKSVRSTQGAEVLQALRLRPEERAGVGSPTEEN